MKLNIIAQADTVFHSNGKMKAITERKYTENLLPHGLYQEFDSLGNLITIGNYEFKKTVACKNCYEIDYESVNQKYSAIDSSGMVSLKIGTWTSYYSNGKIKAIGKYSDKIHIYFGYIYPKKVERELYKIRHKYDDLKEGKWLYYDENGKNYLIEYYVEGDLIRQEFYE